MGFINNPFTYKKRANKFLIDIGIAIGRLDDQTDPANPDRTFLPFALTGKNLSHTTGAIRTEFGISRHEWFEWMDRMIGTDMETRIELLRQYWDEAIARDPKRYRELLQAHREFAKTLWP